MIFKNSKHYDLLKTIALLLPLFITFIAAIGEIWGLENIDKIINIDHHDKTKDSIKATLSIIDTNASSTCEMIAFFLKEKEIKILLALGRYTFSLHNRFCRLDGYDRVEYV